jgi:hypothetical protein
MEAMKQIRNGELASVSDREVNGGVAPEGFAECFRRAAGKDDEGVRSDPPGLPCGVQAAVFSFTGDDAPVDDGDITGGSEWHGLITGRFEATGHGRRLSLIETAPDGLE